MGAIAAKIGGNTGGAGGSAPIGPTTPSDFMQGSVIFAGAAELAENNDAFFWDDATNQLRLTAGAATDTPLRVRGAAAQSANLQEWQNNASTALSYVLSDGRAKFPAGSQGTPSIGWTGESNLGFIFGPAAVGITNGGNYSYDFTNSSTKGLRIGNGFALSFGSGQLNATDTDTGLTRIIAGIVGITNASTGAGGLGMSEMTAPAAPAANGVYIYAQDNGAGKTQLMARFNTGAAQQIAIEP